MEPMFELGVTEIRYGVVAFNVQLLRSVGAAELKNYVRRLQPGRPVRGLECLQLSVRLHQGKSGRPVDHPGALRFERLRDRVAGRRYRGSYRIRDDLRVPLNVVSLGNPQRGFQPIRYDPLDRSNSYPVTLGSLLAPGFQVRALFRLGQFVVFPDQFPGLASDFRHALLPATVSRDLRQREDGQDK